MRVYDLKVIEYFESYSIKDFGVSECDIFDGTERMEDTWEEKTLERVGGRKKGDLAFCFDPMRGLILSQKAVETLKDEFDFEEMELLPLKRGKNKYYILHGNKTYRVFHETIFKGVDVFHKFNEQELIGLGIDKKLIFRGEYNHGVISGLFFTEKFVELVQKYDLQGVDFTVVWDSEVER